MELISKPRSSFWFRVFPFQKIILSNKVKTRLVKYR